MSRSYKLALILAIILHVALIVFLFIKFALPNRYTISNSANIINATAIISTDIPPPTPKPILEKPRPKPIIPEKIIPKKEIPIKKPLLKTDDTKELQNELKAETKQLHNIKQKKVLQDQLDNELKAETKALQSAQVKTALSSQQNGEIDKYKAMLIQTISSNWVVPDDVDKNSSCILLVEVAPGGVVLDVKIIQASNNPILDRSAKAAVLKSSPLPVPEEPILFDSFRSIKLIVKPEGITN